MTASIAEPGLDAVLHFLQIGICLRDLQRNRLARYEAAEPPLPSSLLQLQPLVDQPVLGFQRLDRQPPRTVAVDDLGAARGVGGVEIGLGRIRRENSQRAGLGRRIRERQAWRPDRRRGR